MSRCTLESEKFDVVIGWDPPIGSFFLQILEPGGDTPVVWEGVGRKRHSEPDELIEMAANVCKPFDKDRLRHELLQDQGYHLERHYGVDGNEVWGTPADFIPPKAERVERKTSSKQPHQYNGRLPIRRSDYPRLIAWVAIILVTGAAGLFGRGFGGVALAACAGFTFYLCRWIQDLAHGRYERVALKNKQLIDWVAIIFFAVVPTIFAL